MERVYVTRRGGTGTSFGCLGSIAMVMVVVAAVAVLAAVGLVVLAVIAAGVLVTGIALVTQRAWRMARGNTPPGARDRRGVIEATATEVRTDRPTLPEDGPGPVDGEHGGG